MKSFTYTICDVFTEKAFGGNPLAVFPEAEGLSAEQMQSIAREFNFSETTFVFPAQGEGTHQVRIFTPSREVPFAGHPNIGTACVLAAAGAQSSEVRGEYVFEEQAGIVNLKVTKEEVKLSAELVAPQSLSVEQEIDTSLLADALGLNQEDLDLKTHRPTVASVGLPFIFVEVKDQSALARIEINQSALKEIQSLGVMPDIHVYCKAGSGTEIQARMFAPFDGVPEDPATGSANAALGAFLSSLEDEEDGQWSYAITQGVEMGRPSQLKVRTVKTRGRVSEVRLSGSTVIVARGEFFA